MQTRNDYEQSLGGSRVIRLNGSEFSHPSEHPSLRLGYEANKRFYDITNSEGFRKILEKEPSNKSLTKHPFFEPVHSQQGIQRCSECLDFVQEAFDGLYTRAPDYKGAFITCLSSNADAFGDHRENAIKWHQKISSTVPALSHAFVSPSSFGATDLQSMRGLKVVSKDSEGIVVRGLKAVSTGATAAQYVYVRDSRPADSKQMGLCFFVPLDADGLKLICTQPITTQTNLENELAFPISHSLDENDTILLFDDVFIKNENVLCAEILETQRWHQQQSGFIHRARFHGTIRVLRKLELILGFFVVAAPRMKPGSFQTRQLISEVQLSRQVLKGLHTSMVSSPDTMENGELVPNKAASAAAYIMVPKLIAAIRNLLSKNFAGPLTSIPSSSQDVTNDELELLWGDAGSRAHMENSIGYIRGARELLLGEFGLRQELFEANYLGSADLAYGDLFEHVRLDKATADAIESSKSYMTFSQTN